MLETATKYILTILAENEELQKFPRDFVTASMQWIRSWFLVDDPVSERILTSAAKSAETKKDIVEAKLMDLQQNSAFMEELKTQLTAFQAHRERLKNVIENTDLDVQGNFHHGDRGAPFGDTNYDLKNVARGSKIKVGGDYHLGDDNK